MEKSQLAQEFYDMAPLIVVMNLSLDYGNSGIEVHLTPTYRACVRMLDAWKNGDTSSLSQQERAALDEAQAIVTRLQTQYSSGSLELERAIFDEICVRLTHMDSPQMPAGEVADCINADYALMNGRANCQGYAETFYLLASMAGFEVSFLNGWSSGGLPHTWNTIQLSGQWYIVDVDSADFSGDAVSPETGVYLYFNAGRNRCEGLLSWKPYYETADISDISDNNFFFYAGIPGFGASFDNLDYMAQYCYNERAYDGERDNWIMLSGYGEEVPIDAINAAMVRATNQHSNPTQWQFWSWPSAGQQCILMRWEAF